MPRKSPEKKLAETDPANGLSSYRKFGESVLGKQFYPRQAEVLDALKPEGSFVAFCSCNGGGKTREVILTAILAHLTLYKGKCISTSGSFRQIKDQLTPALRAYATRFPQFDFQENRIVTQDPNSFWDGFSTNEAGKFEGHHGSEANPLLIVVDEAKTPKDAIFQAVERCRPPRQHCRILYASSPGYAQGEFYRMMTSGTAALSHAPIRQTAAECPHITAEEIAATRAKWGTDHPLVRSMLDAQFMPFVEGAIVQIGALDDLLANPPPANLNPSQRKGFCDFAWSESAQGDENVFAWRSGNVIKLEAFRAKGIVAVCGEFIRLFTREGFKPWEIEGDADGEGANIIKQLRAMGWPIGSAHNGGKPRFNDHYHNLAAEMWCEGAQAIIRRDYVLPDDPDLYGQMLDRKLVARQDGKLAIESKQAMKDTNREGGAVRQSPDRADAVFGCMAALPMTQARQVMNFNQNLPDNRDTLWDRPTRNEEPEVPIPGAYFG